MNETLAITAAAALTPYGLGPGDFAQGFNQAAMPFRCEASLGDYLKDSTAINAAFVPDYDTKALLNTRSVSHFDRITRHLCVASEMLHEAMGFPETGQRRAHVEDERVSLVVGCNGPLQSIMGYDLQAVRDPQFVQPGLFPNAVYNVPASYAAIRRSIRGSCITLTNGATSVVDAFGIAGKQLAAGRIDLSIVGGAEEMTPAYAALVTSMGPDPGRPCRALSEGAYLFCVESPDKARARGQEVLALLLATASVFCPDPREGLRECLVRLESATGVDVAKVGWVCTDGPVDPEALGMDDCKLIHLEERLGYLGAMYAAAGVMAVLSTPEVGEGDLALVLCCGRQGACGALLMEKRASLA